MFEIIQFKLTQKNMSLIEYFADYNSQKWGG